MFDDQSNKNQDAIAVAGVAVGGAITVATGEGQWDLWSVPLGFMLLLTLIGFVPVAHARRWDFLRSGAYALIAGLCLTIVVAPFIEMALRNWAITDWSITNGYRCHLGPFTIHTACAFTLDAGETILPELNEPLRPEGWGMYVVDYSTLGAWTALTVIWLVVLYWNSIRVHILRQAPA
jgi:hypothetical protein